MTDTATQTPEIRPDTLADVYERLDGPVFMTGMNALVRSMLVQAERDRRAGIQTAGYVTGYRGSPLGGVDVAMQKAGKHLAARGIRFHPGLNEDLAATAVWGTQQAGLFEKPLQDGVVGVWYGKGPGVDRSGDALKHGNLAGTSRHGGVVVLAGDDHTCKSSTTAHQSEPALIAAGIPVLNPAGVEEVVPYFLAAVAISRFSGLWVSLKCLTDVMDSSATVTPHAGFTLADPEGVAMPEGGLNIRRSDSPIAQESRLIDWKLPAAQAFARANGLDRVTLAPKAKRFGIVTCGKSWLDVQDALHLLGLDEAACADLGIGIYKVAMTWPLVADTARNFAAGFEEVLVVEEKRPLVEDQLRAALYDMDPGQRPAISGKTAPGGERLLSSSYELDPASIAIALGARLVARGVIAAVPDLPAPSAATASGEKRVTWFYAGCPHNTSTRVPEGSLGSAGIGCHGLAAFNDADTTLPFTQMGAEGLNWVGRAPFVDGIHIFQNLGDGTYNHSGLLAIRAAVGAGVNITYKILFNDAVAMTGGQAHDGGLSVPAIARQVVAEGVVRTAVVSDDPSRHAGVTFPPGVTLHHRDELHAVQSQMRDTAGVTVIIYDQGCATELRRRRKRGLAPKPDVAVHINPQVCEGCGDCGAQSNCVAIQPQETPLGIRRRIDQSMCNVDLSCLKGFCPSFVTVSGILTEGPKAARPKLPSAPEVAPPVVPALSDKPHSILLTGIGGTGIITISALLGMAAHLDGRHVRVVDQTGMAQKNGMVTSHVLIAANRSAPLPSRIGRASADVIIGCDLLGASEPEQLALARAGATRALINADVTTTGRFTRKPDLDLGVAVKRARIETQLGRDHVDYVDVTRLATDLFGDATMTNMLMLGQAWQKGLIPLSFAAIDRAIELNGVAIGTNRAAFAWGRAIAQGLRPGIVAALPVAEPASPDLIADLRNRLVAYGGEAGAQRFDALVDRMRQAEVAKLGLDANMLTITVARAMHKLLAYKDEYEVARLLTDPDELAAIRARHPAGARLGFHLAPPLLSRTDPRTGHPRKIRFGEWVLPGFRLLAKMRWLRGTMADPFGYTRERRQERRAIRDYEALVETIAARLTPDRAAIAQDLLALPLSVRGFGHVKDAARELALARERDLMARFTAEQPGAGAVNAA